MKVTDGASSWLKKAMGESYTRLVFYALMALFALSALGAFQIL